MNTEPCCKKAGTAAYVIGVAGTFLLMAALVWLMRSYTQTPALAAVRGQERLKIMADFKAVNTPLLDSYEWQDQGKGFVRVPVEVAKQLILNEWQDPAAGRSNLMSRAEKAFAPAPKPPEQKNVYE